MVMVEVVVVEVILTIITGPGETPASVHAQVNAGTILTAGSLTDHPEVPVLLARRHLQLTGVPEQLSQVSVNVELSLISPVSFPIRAADLRSRGPGTVTAPLSITGEHRPSHRQSAAAGLEDGLPGRLRERPGGGWQ